MGRVHSLQPFSKNGSILRKQKLENELFKRSMYTVKDAKNQK